MALDAIFGEPRWLWSRVPHPAVLLGRAVSWLESQFYDFGPDRQKSGMFAVGVLAIGALTLGCVLGGLGWLAEALIAATLLAQKSLASHIQSVGDALRLSLHDGRIMVARIVSRDTSDMTRDQTARAAIESGAENLSDGVVAPIFWFVIAGLPGLLLYKAVNTADSMIGYRNERYEQFGWAAARLDDVLNWVPARLTALVIAGLSGNLRFWSDIALDAGQHRSPNAGWPESAAARALNVALAGPRSYDGEMRQLAWVNKGGDHEIGPTQIDLSVALLWRVWGVLFLAVALWGLMSLT
jgi:adenosylcobinamide-phosphate synthase